MLHWKGKGTACGATGVIRYLRKHQFLPLQNETTCAYFTKLCGGVNNVTYNIYKTLNVALGKCCFIEQALENGESSLKKMPQL